MVCRENKGRSAIMGYVKHLQRELGGEAFNDAEVQSLIHQVKHDGDALDVEAPLTKGEQVDMMRRLRSQIIENPSISEEEKYRQSTQRPGIVTRLDEEIARIESGKTAKGDPLTASQLNTASHMYAMQRLGNTLERINPAKQEFLETNARHRGISYEEAQAEWSQLMSQKGHFESRSLIRDDVRESLATAGIDSHVQANLGASGRAINAMEVMEARRMEMVKNSESKPAVTKEHSLATFVAPGSKEAQLRCGKCGQFGHEDSSCPNLKQVERLEDIRAERRLISRAEEIAHDRHFVDTASDDAIRELYGVDDVDQERADQRRTLDAMEKELSGESNGTGAKYLDERYRKRAQVRIEREEKRAEKEISNNAAIVSKDVSDVQYNEDSGVIVIHRTPDEDGQPRDPLIRRCHPDEAADFSERLRTESLDDVLASSMDTDRHKFANRGDAQAALTMNRCPTCGQWASMTSGHKCPVPGGPSEELEHDRRRARIEQQQKRRKSKVDGGEPVATFERDVDFHGHQGQRKRNLRYSLDGEQGAITVNNYRFGKPKEVLASVDEGKVALPAVSASFEDGQVSGRVSVWANDDGERMLSAYDTGLAEAGLKCDCADYAQNYRCKHIQATRVMVQQAYGEAGTPTRALPDGVVPGDRIIRGTNADQTAQDGLEINEERIGMNRLQAIKRSRRWEEMQHFVSNRAAGQGTTTLMVEGPRDGNGDRAEWPETWAPQPTTDDGTQRRKQSLGKATDLTNRGAVADRFRTLMSNRYVEMPDGSKERIKYAANMSSNPGGITINLPRSFQRTTPARRRAAQKGLADMLGVSQSTVTEKGLFIPDNTASYAEYLDRASQNVNTRRINGPQTVSLPTAESYEASRKDSLRGWRGVTPNV